ncbi:MAG: hypothetical protein Q8N34_04905 [Gammaproteobacteria bacterium]|nr:hypothetical protein [Gammaproteobacteria bacterium]
MTNKRIETRVFGQDEALRGGRPLNDTPQVKGDMEIQCILAGAFDLLEGHPGESVSAFFPFHCLWRILLCAYKYDAFI